MIGGVWSTITSSVSRTTGGKDLLATLLKPVVSFVKPFSVKSFTKREEMLPISLSYDHRIIDGAEAARFNNDLKENLGNNFAYKLAV